MHWRKGVVNKPNFETKGWNNGKLWVAGNKIGDKEISIRYLGVKLVGVFMFDLKVPFGEMAMDSHKLEVPMNNSSKL